VNRSLDGERNCLSESLALQLGTYDIDNLLRDVMRQPETKKKEERVEWPDSAPSQRFRLADCVHP